VELVRAIDAGDRPKALELQLRILDYLNAIRPLTKVYGRGVTQVGLKLHGIKVKQYPRRPVRPMPPEDQEKLRNALEAVGAVRAGALNMV
jgi:dihydrodipicolinate synthase/N-acetylneuraminate lyase